jgi:HK97 family phage prohead protease
MTTSTTKQHLTVKADVATATDQGWFEALAAAYTVDSGNEQISKGAFSASIERWQKRDRMVPLHWDHEGGPENVIGTVDPQYMKEVSDGLYVTGELHIEESEVAREAWRLVKRNAVALSFGYLVERSHDRRDGVKVLDEVNVFEISLTPAPMNEDTKIISYKSADRAKPEVERKPAPIQIASFKC